MQIAIAASGTRGDVQPYVALGKGLRAAGHQVRLLTSDDFAGLVGDAGLEFASMGESIEKMLQSEEWRKTTESGNFLAILARMNSEMKRRAEALASRIPALLRPADLIVAGVGGIGGPFSAAETFGIPIIQAYVFPITPTRAFASPLTPKLPMNALNPLSFQMMRQMLWQSTRVADVTTRRALGMRRGSIFGPFRALEGQPILYGYSRHVLPRPADWSDGHSVTGYWFLDAPGDWQPPADLVNFLRAGAPPVYIGFGSMGSRSPKQAAELALRALARSGQRGVLASGWGGLRSSDLPDSVYMLSSVPHSWLFPQMAAVVHHGGAGTTAAGLRAGVPSIVVPHMGDQAFWGHRIAALGVGTPPIPRKRLTAAQLAHAITQTVTDQAMRGRAAALGAAIRAEDGIGQAVELIERLSERTTGRHIMA
jgi:sterol 3beta-glucosyltransferase